MNDTTTLGSILVIAALVVCAAIFYSSYAFDCSSRGGVLVRTLSDWTGYACVKVQVVP